MSLNSNCLEERFAVYPVTVASTSYSNFRTSQGICDRKPQCKSPGTAFHISQLSRDLTEKCATV